MSQSRKCRFENSFRSVGVCFALPFAIIADKYLTSESLQMDYTSSDLAKKLPIEFYRVASPFIVMGISANNFSNLGSSIDSMIDSVKTFPYCGSWDDFKNWTKAIKSKNVGHVTGALFGTGVGAYFIYCNVTDPSATFLSPYGQTNTIPAWLFQIGAMPYIAGGCSNAFSQLTEGTTDLIKVSFKYSKHLKERVSNCCFTFFRGSSPSQPDNQSTTDNINMLSRPLI
ncbi:MAG: hypothetical protein P4M12_06415 [Gammaproteobacteria bacterium]|nr:hypothetical protein [Gammaproteobacteria bacterium]